MNYISALLNLVAEFIATNPTSQSIQNLITVMTLFIQGKNGELAEFLKNTFFCGTKLLDEGIIITPYNGPEKTNTELLEIFVQKAKEKGYTMAFNNDSTGYYDDIKDSGFLEEFVVETSPEMYLPILPESGLTEGEMFAEAKTADKEHEHLVCDAIRTAIALLDADFYKEKGTWTSFFLKNKRKSDGLSYEFIFGFECDLEFHVSMLKVDPGRECSGSRLGLPLSNKSVKD
jgi:hypothetical protein